MYRPGGRSRRRYWPWPRQNPGPGQDASYPTMVAQAAIATRLLDLTPVNASRCVCKRTPAAASADLVLDLGRGREEPVALGIVEARGVDQPRRHRRRAAFEPDRRRHRRHGAVARLRREIEVVGAAGREQRRERRDLAVHRAEPGIDLLVTAKHHRAAEPGHERLELALAEREPRVLRLQIVGDVVGGGRIAPQHLEPDVRSGERGHVGELRLDVRIARDAGVDEHQIVEEQHVRQLVEHPHVVLEHFARDVTDQRVDRLGRLHAAVDPAAILDVVLVVAAQREHVIRRREVQLHHGAQHAVVAEHPAIDVIAEEDELRLGLAVVELPRLELREEVGLEQRALQARVATVEIAEHRDVVDRIGPGRMHEHVAVEERLVGREVRDRLLAGELSNSLRALRGELGDEPVHEIQVGLDLLRDPVGIRGVVVLERGEERVVVETRSDRRRVGNRDLVALEGLAICFVDRRRVIEQRFDLVAELLLARVDRAVGVDQLVDRRQQLVLVVAIERLEDLVRAELELRVAELLDVFTVGHGLVEQRLDAALDLLEHLVEVTRELVDDLVAGLRIGVGHRELRARGDELADVDPDERLLGEVELAIDVPECSQVEDDRVHLLFGDVWIRAEREHRPKACPDRRQACKGGAVYDLAVGTRPVRAPVVVLALLCAGTAYGDPYVEGSAFFGVADFGSQIALGGSLAPEQRPQTSPMFGARLTAILVRTVVFDLGVEPELELTPSWTGYGFDGPRDSYFAPVFGYRGSLLLRMRVPRAVRFHALAGLGGATVVSKSPYMSTDTDPVLYYGVGATLALGENWEMRLDVRQGIMPARDGGSTAINEAMNSLSQQFRAVPAPAAKPPEEHPPLAIVTPPPVVEAPPAPDPDTDHDGIPDRLDKCPEQPEDKDGFEDADGCPELDNDLDGVPDAKDKSTNEPETRNGY